MKDAYQLNPPSIAAVIRLNLIFFFFAHLSNPHLFGNPPRKSRGRRRLAECVWFPSTCSFPTTTSAPGLLARNVIFLFRRGATQLNKGAHALRDFFFLLRASVRPVDELAARRYRRRCADSEVRLNPISPLLAPLPLSPGPSPPYRFLSAGVSQF